MTTNIIIAILLLFLNLLFPRKKTGTIMIFLFMWTLWGWNTFNGDYESYKVGFEEALSSTNDLNEFGYKWINYFLFRLGFTFRGYYVLTSGLLLLGIFHIVRKYCPYPGLFGFLYFFAFIQYYVYLRNYIICVVLISVILKIINEKKSRIFFFITCLLLSTIHSISYLFLIFTFAFKNKRLNTLRILSYELVCFVLSYFLFSYIVGSILPNMSFGERANVYIDGGASLGMSIPFLVVFVLSTLYVLKKIITTSSDDESSKYLNVLYNINLLSLFICSLCVVVPYTAGRFFMFLIHLDILGCLYCLYKSIHQKRHIIICVGYFFVVLFSMLVFLSMSNHPFTTIPLFMCNELWGDNYYVPDTSLSNTQN